MRDLVWAIVIVITYLLIFTYGIIWLERGFDVKEKFGDVRKEILQTRYEYTQMNKDSKNYVDQNMNRVMNSCFKGEKTWREPAQRP